MKVKIKYFVNDIDKICKFDQGDWIDLRAAETVTMKAGEYRLIRLGVGMILPKGYEAHIVPRSSTFGKYKIIQTNHCGIIDESYCGDNDEWLFPAYAVEDTTINKNARICQFRLIEKQPPIEFEETVRLTNQDRGSFGSTGIQQHEVIGINEVSLNLTNTKNNKISSDLEDIKNNKTHCSAYYNEVNAELNSKLEKCYYRLFEDYYYKWFIRHYKAGN